MRSAIWRKRNTTKRGKYLNQGFVTVQGTFQLQPGLVRRRSSHPEGGLRTEAPRILRLHIHIEGGIQIRSLPPP